MFAVEIWALSSPYDPTQHNPYTTNEGRQGFQIASKDLGLLPCNATQAQIYDLPLQPPPPGNYYLGVFLMASPLLNCRTPDGYCILDHFNNALQQSFGSSAAGTAPASAFAPTVGLWWNPAEPGTGYSIDIKHGVLVATVFSYKANGDAEWYLASGPLSADGKSFVGTLDKYQGGQCIFCAFNRSPTKIGNDGIVSIQFSSPTSASLTLPGGRVVPIQPQAF